VLEDPKGLQNRAAISRRKREDSSSEVEVLLLRKPEAAMLLEC
jgi:hypothetical protein